MYILLELSSKFISVFTLASVLHFVLLLLFYVIGLIIPLCVFLYVDLFIGFEGTSIVYYNLIKYYSLDIINL